MSSSLGPARTGVFGKHEPTDVLKGFKMRLSWLSTSSLHPKGGVLTTHGREEGRKGKMGDCDFRDGDTDGDAWSH